MNAIKRGVAAISLLLWAALWWPSWANAQSAPRWTSIGVPEKSYTRASVDTRNVGCVDFWFIGHDFTEGAYKCFLTGGISQTRAVALPYTDPDGDYTDTHGAAFEDLDGDGLKDLVLVGGADRGEGTSWASVFKNTSSASAIRWQRVDERVTTGLNAGAAIYGRNRRATFFRWADGAIGLWTMTQGQPRTDGNPNVNRVFRYNGNWQFTEVPNALVNTPGLKDGCAVVADLNGDGLDDLLQCMAFDWNQNRVPSRVLYQQPDGTFVLAALPFSINDTRWVTAEVADMNGDGRPDIVAALQTPAAPRVVIWHQQPNGTYTATPQVTIVTSRVPNSIAVGRLNADALPDLYFAHADLLACQTAAATTGAFSDTWPDQVAMSNGAGGYVVTTLTNEPSTGCSNLATWAGPGTVHVAHGIEGAAGPQYTVKF